MMQMSSSVRLCRRVFRPNLRSYLTSSSPSCSRVILSTNSRTANANKNSYLKYQPQYVRLLHTTDIKLAHDERELRPDYCVTYDELKYGVENDKFLVIDVRRPDEVAEGRMKAKRYVNIPVQEFEEALQLSDKDFKDTYGIDKPPKDASDIIFHCKLGGRSTTALRLAQNAGYTKSKHYPGGWSEWSEKN
uniref:rhodanese domain-containing protein CG4456-like n=1 Tax=Styela clava TaxID=7725 RepID=UPI00193A0305|nr:rhodanese domain-containing protein CG4456-like [Styela clava]